VVSDFVLILVTHPVPLYCIFVFLKIENLSHSQASKIRESAYSKAFTSLQFVSCHLSSWLITRAVKRLITINHIQNKCVYIINVCELCIIILCIYKHTHIQYMYSTGQKF